MLRRFADARLRRALVRALAARHDAQHTARILDAQLRQARAEARTNYDLMERWKSIALNAQSAAISARQACAAHSKETTP